MRWFSYLGDAFNQAFTLLPKWSLNISIALVCFSMAILMTVKFGQVSYSIVKEMLPVTTEDIQAAQLRVELEKLEAEAQYVNQLAFDRTKIEREMQQAKVEAHRISLGLQPNQSSDAGVNSLAALGQVATTNLPTILLLMFAFYFLPVFATTGEHWRLILIVALLTVVAGAFALATNVAALTKIEAHYKDFFVTVSSASLAFYLTFFGVLLSAFPLYMLERQHRTASAKLTDDA